MDILKTIRFSAEVVIHLFWYVYSNYLFQTGIKIVIIIFLEFMLVAFMCEYDERIIDVLDNA